MTVFHTGNSPHRHSYYHQSCTPKWCNSDKSVTMISHSEQWQWHQCHTTIPYLGFIMGRPVGVQSLTHTHTLWGTHTHECGYHLGYGYGRCHTHCVTLCGLTELTHTASISQCFMTKHCKKIEERDTLLFPILFNKRKQRLYTILFVIFVPRHDLRPFHILKQKEI